MPSSDTRELTSSTDLSPTLVRVAVPHFCRMDGASAEGYGSSRDEARVHRGVALSRCLGSLLALARGLEESILGIADQTLIDAPASICPECHLSAVILDCHVFVTGDSFQADILSAFDRRITVHHVDLPDPRRLPHAARDFLLQDLAPGNADLSLYLEDDLVVHDRLFVDKFMWFFQRTDHQFALMPHRYELTGDPCQARLFVDGPIAEDIFPGHHQPRESVARGRFWDGQSVDFDIAANPHSGCFGVSAQQRQFLVGRVCADDGFISPLETVATFTVLQHWPVIKPSWQHRDFLLVEHAHPSFLWARHQWSEAGG